MIHPHLLLLRDQAVRAERAADLLHRYFDGDGGAEPIAALESEAGAANAELARRLRRSFITPLDAEDLQAVSAALTRSVQAVRRAAAAGAVVPERRRLAPLQGRVAAMARALSQAISRVAAGEAAYESAVAMMQGPREMRSAMREASAAGLRDEGDLRGLLARRHLQAAVEDEVYRLRKTGLTLRTLILKNG